jgi:hypothetical protein
MKGEGHMLTHNEQINTFYEKKLGYKYRVLRQRIRPVMERVALLEQLAKDALLAELEKQYESTQAES